MGDKRVLSTEPESKRTALSPARLAELRELAKKATPGPYTARAMLSDKHFVLKAPSSGWVASTKPVDADYFAALDPTTVLALLDAAEELARLDSAPDPIRSMSEGKRLVIQLHGMLKTMRTENSRLRGEVSRLREALRWIADISNWCDEGGVHDGAVIDKARAALAAEGVG